jgi:hypothetical protein
MQVICVAPSTADLSESTSALHFGTQAMSVRVQVLIYIMLCYGAPSTPFYLRCRCSYIVTNTIFPI